MTTLDRQGPEVGADPVEWVVTKLEPRTGDPEYQQPFAEVTEIVRGSSVAVVDGALVFRNGRGDMVKSYGPSGWLEVERA